MPQISLLLLLIDFVLAGLSLKAFKVSDEPWEHWALFVPASLCAAHIVVAIQGNYSQFMPVPWHVFTQAVTIVTIVVMLLRARKPVTAKIPLHSGRPPKPKPSQYRPGSNNRF